MSDGDPGKEVTIYPPPGRCPSWSPGNELRCFGTKGHPGDCWAYRPDAEAGYSSSGHVDWIYHAPPEEEDQKEEASEAAYLVSDRILADMMEEEQ